MGSRLHFYRISPRKVGALLSAALLLSAGGSALTARADSVPTLTTGQACYVVGQAVDLSGSGFAPDRTYVVTVDGVYLGNSTTDAQGTFSVPVRPGGLPAGTAQHIDSLEVSDGTSSASAAFTLTRKAGARIFATSGSQPNTIKARFQVWGYAMNVAARTVYVHYVAPSGRSRKTVALGTTSGQCGALRTGRRRLFPLSVSKGKWTLQLDTRSSYSRRPGGPVSRITVNIT